MWAIRILAGPQAGRIFPLKPGSNTLGRAPSCDIKILSPNVSKEHVKIDVLQDKFIITDMGSRNGTFVNGTQYRSTKVKPGDRIGLHEVVIEIVPFSQAQAQMPSMTVGAPTPQYQMPQAPMGGMYAPPSQEMPPAESPSRSNMDSMASVVMDYIERVVMPGVYHLAEIIDFKTLLALFMAGFILLVTSLSTIPLIRILRDTVEQQSQQHALTIAATLARVNEGPIREGLYTAINMSTAQRTGVTDALIISKVDGKIIAPASKAESYPDIPFVHEARLGEKEAVRQIDSNTVVALVPIAAYNPETGGTGTLAFAVVKYDMTTLAVDDSKTISLFVITLFIATILGFVLFYFLYNLIAHPLNSLNSQLSRALREGRDDVKVSFLFEPIRQLTSNINSALARALSGGGDAPAPMNFEHDRRLEMSNIVEMVGFAGLVISAVDRSIVSVNQAFEQRTRLNSGELLNLPVQQISDQAFRLSIVDLLDRLDQNPDQLVNNELEFGGVPHQLIAQAIFGSSKIAYYLVIAVPSGGES